METRRDGEEGSPSTWINTIKYLRGRLGLRQGPPISNNLQILLPNILEKSPSLSGPPKSREAIECECYEEEDSGSHRDNSIGNTRDVPRGLSANNVEGEYADHKCYERPDQERHR